MHCKLKRELVCVGFEYQSMSIGTIESLRFPHPSQ